MRSASEPLTSPFGREYVSSGERGLNAKFCAALPTWKTVTAKAPGSFTVSCVSHPGNARSTWVPGERCSSTTGCRGSSMRR